MRTLHLCIRLEVFSKDAIGDGLEITMSHMIKELKTETELKKR